MARGYRVILKKPILGAAVCKIFSWQRAKRTTGDLIFLDIEMPVRLELLPLDQPPGDHCKCL